ncbi:MAG: hypothetical protein ACO25B_10790 [Chitinophagaceae bacterium]
MKPILYISFLLCTLTGCKKTIENIQEDLVIKAMTDGQWAITSFIKNGSDITSTFSSYRFKYYNNPKKVDAINSGSVETTGDWGGNSADMTTWANFSTASYPLTLINGTWNINRNSWTYVEATQTVGAEIYRMRLDKQ